MVASPLFKLRAVTLPAFLIRAVVLPPLRTVEKVIQFGNDYANFLEYPEMFAWRRMHFSFGEETIQLAEQEFGTLRTQKAPYRKKADPPFERYRQGETFRASKTRESKRENTRLALQLRSKLLHPLTKIIDRKQ